MIVLRLFGPALAEENAAAISNNRNPIDDPGFDPIDADHAAGCEL